ncbi:MAG: iron ABC transporter permease [Acidimicrobiales bacterium]|nr:iron ABC transporter permease [Acidimicrobiales bacterium]
MPVTFAVLFLVVPLVAIVRRGLADADIGLLAQGWLWRVVWFTTWQAAASTVLTILLGLPIAHVLSRYRFRGAALLRGLVTVPFVLPTVVVAAAFTALMERTGLDGGAIRIRHTIWVVLAAHVFFNLSVVVRTVGGVWGQLDPRLEDGARVLGASPVRVFAEVTLPRLLPAIWAAAAIVFLFCFTSFGVILLLGGPGKATVETEIWRYATQRTRFDVAAVLALVQVVTVGIALVANVALQRRLIAPERPVGAELARTRPTGWARMGLLTLVLAEVAVIVGAPVGALVERSLAVGEGYGFDHYRALVDPVGDVPGFVVPAGDAIVNSLTIALAATLMAVLIGALTSVVAAGGARLGAAALEVLMLVPLGVSTVTLGFGYLLAFDDPPLDLRSTWVIIPLAHALIGVPFVVRIVLPVLRHIDAELREAAAVLGASPRRVLYEIDLPIGGRALAVGAGFAFAVSLGEFGATSFLARPSTPTVPLAIFRLLGRPGEQLYGQAMALSVVLVALTAISVLALERMRGRAQSGF